jgi:DNA-binding NarL/FixJ family response regulator
MQRAASSPNASMAKLSILIVDDHPIMRMGIAGIINTQGDMHVCAEAGTGQQAVELFEKRRPDITLMDLRLPGMSGLEALRAIRQIDSHARCIVLTTYEGDEDIYQAIAAGAFGYLIKGMPHQSLVEALRKVGAGCRFLPSPIMRTLADRTPNSELSPRESEVLALMVRGMSNKAIAKVLDITEATVKCHVSVILQRLNVEDRTQAVVVALQRGLAHL